MSWLNELVVGDKVVCNCVGWNSFTGVGEVARITKTLIILKSKHRFSKSNGFTPGNSYHRNRLEPWTQCKEDEIRQNFARQKNIRFLDATDFEELRSEALQKLVDLIKLDESQ
jgi:hypothetical protein